LVEVDQQTVWLRHRDEMQQNCCFVIRTRQISFAELEEIVNRDWISWTGTFSGYTLCKSTQNYLCL